MITLNVIVLQFDSVKFNYKWEGVGGRNHRKVDLTLYVNRGGYGVNFQFFVTEKNVSYQELFSD